jgi:hypothetical protein
MSTVWAADFETPVGSTTFFSFFVFFESIGRNKQLIKFALWPFKVHRPHSICQALFYFKLPKHSITHNKGKFLLKFYFLLAFKPLNAAQL